MGPESQNQRISRISTLWSLVQQAHAGPLDEATAAQRRLMQRYCGAVHRYLLGALHDEDAAAELFQEFALRFLRGDFHRADPRRGRFRDYLKTALIHLVTDYHKAQRRRPGPLPDGLAAPAEVEVGEAFLQSWREELLNRTWDALAAAQPTFHVVLLFHVQHPEMVSPQMAAELAGPLGKRLTPTHVRVLLHRAREKFADLLVDEVYFSLPEPTEEQLQEELEVLHLKTLCQPALGRRHLGTSPGGQV